MTFFKDEGTNQISYIVSFKFCRWLYNLWNVTTGTFIWLYSINVSNKTCVKLFCSSLLEDSTKGRLWRKARTNITKVMHVLQGPAIFLDNVFMSSEMPRLCCLGSYTCSSTKFRNSLRYHLLQILIKNNLKKKMLSWLRCLRTNFYSAKI